MCNGASTTVASFSGIATSYTWVNDTPAIGLAANGTGNIGSFSGEQGDESGDGDDHGYTALRQRRSQLRWISEKFKITVNPSPTVAQSNDQTVCNGAGTTAVSFSGTATSYTWVNDTPAIGLAASGTGNIASFNGVNSGWRRCRRRSR